MPFTFLIILAILAIIDIYAFRGIKRLFAHRRLSFFRLFVLRTYWFVDLFIIIFAFLWAWHVRSSDFEEYVQYRKFFLIMAAFMLVFLPKAVMFLFTIFYDIKNLLLRFSQWMFHQRPVFLEKLSRWRRSVLIPALGFLAAAFMFSVTLYGVGIGRFNFRVEEIDVWFDDLPPDFDGFRIVQFSDTHLGSFSDVSAVESGLRLINILEPDLIIFTGDMVNNVADEAIKFVTVFQELQARHGMFSILGNHDMGDYRRWGTIEDKSSNLDKLISLQREMGFDVLLNEHRFIYRGMDSIMIAGVENWGLPPFGQYGDLQRALGINSDFPFIILASHDPSHWRAQVIPETNINLTLSGHTHGMQFGITNRFFSWSPVQLKYNEWSGLYQEGNQKLYVNRGFGYLSFPGRIGMPPEITLIVLRKSPALR